MRLRAAGVALVLLIVPVSLTGCVGCPTALLEGDLARDGTELAVRADDGTITRVRWPAGYRLGTDEYGPDLRDMLGGIVTRESDHVRLGGGFEGEVFLVCGPIVVVPRVGLGA